VSDRLKDLQRQRALAQEQLAWLDREIARETGAAPVATPPPAARPVIAPMAVPSPAVDAEADKIIEQYREQARPVHSEVKRGCLVYFFAAFAVVGLILATLYFARHR
jgi:hypothetical protein